VSSLPRPPEPWSSGRLLLDGVDDEDDDPSVDGGDAGVGIDVCGSLDTGLDDDVDTDGSVESPTEAEGVESAVDCVVEAVDDALATVVWLSSVFALSSWV
jgi:hypothetical protein